MTDLEKALTFEFRPNRIPKIIRRPRNAPRESRIADTERERNRPWPTVEEARGNQSRFEERCVPEPNCGCWLWIAARTNAGYGQFRIPLRRTIKAHRASWMIYRGEIPEGHFLCHRCDVPACVNPDHLFLGTPLDNTRDCKAKGRMNKALGEMSGQSKLTEADVLAIRASAEGPNAAANRYGVSYSAIYRIRARKVWKHVP